MVKKYYTNIKIGVIKKKIFKVLQKIYGFNEWHIEPVNFRPYALSIIDNLSKNSNDLPIVELGCGLGEIIGAIDTKSKKYGLDISNPVLKAAKILQPNVKFKLGSFQEVEFEKKGVL